ncbi:hypothetical protein HYV11_03370 [Candidatus Dependentiae bacterium]|nr:hypothetical protein [Candidatus Dependentiae bacterium]
MLNKNILFFVILTSSFQLFSQEKSSSEKIIFDNVANATDEIAELIIDCRKEKDPQRIKNYIRRLVQIVVAVTEIFIEAKRMKRLSRSGNLHSQADFDRVIAQQDLEEIVRLVLQKYDEKTEAKN